MKKEIKTAKSFDEELNREGASILPIGVLDQVLKLYLEDARPTDSNLETPDSEEE